MQFVGGSRLIARQQLADNLEPHLKTDETLQRTIVEIGRNALPLRFTCFLGIVAIQHGLARRVREPLFEILALDGEDTAQDSSGDERRPEQLSGMQRRY